MGIDNHIKSLEAKHTSVDEQIRMLPVFPANSEKISALKKEKLRLKDEIARLNNPRRLTAPKSKAKKGKTKKALQEHIKAAPAIQDRPRDTHIDIAA